MVLRGTEEKGARGIIRDRRVLPGGPEGRRLDLITNDEASAWYVNYYLAFSEIVSAS